ncbi:MAG TPA: hypothetical protein VM553_11105, partial [Dongiaceae bacterium]|nr:hypothetical protein [Dongiaceae bacterium]
RSDVPALIVPASVLKVTAPGVRIAVVDSEQRIIFRDVQLGRDLGRTVEVLSGISATDTLVVSPSDLLVEGETVKTLAWTALPPGGGAGGGGGQATQQAKGGSAKSSQPSAQSASQPAPQPATGEKAVQR